MSRQLDQPVAAGESFRLGDWLVEPSLNRVTQGDRSVQLELKVMDVLVCLAERAGEVVTRQEIIDRVWATEFIADNTLTHCITEIRNALGDDARNPSFIGTIHRRGYRLIAPVEPAFSDDAGISTVARFPVSDQHEKRSPYPGLAAFTEADAEFFFGREAEVARMWRKLTSRKLLAVIGPSGVGKSSFVRAGVMASKPKGWSSLYCQPGETPMRALVRSLVPEFEGDSDAIAKLVQLSRPEETAAVFSTWRGWHEQALLVVDQFEELFTLNTWENQELYADLLRLLVDQADIHLVLSMRDDFLYRCQSLKPLRPVLDGLFALEPPSKADLVRALVKPAQKLGFTYEDDRLAGEMVAEVDGERGALPLVAFAVARLWDARNRDRRLLTRERYEEIGGVGGSLARQAESTLKSIGSERAPIVRELFRNLVTSEGTRAVRDVGDLLSVFDASKRIEAETVLRRLIDARLLTSFEDDGVEVGDGRRVEVVHESLLRSWPRLVRWQTQDADAAQLRDQLRQAARTWDEHGRARDFLWTGKAFREFAVWHENYPGRLSELEGYFATAMAGNAIRRKRRRRFAFASVVVFLLTVLAVVGTYWQRSVLEAQRAEAANLESLGQLELESYPSATVAFTIASLELADRPSARRLALEALWEGPTAFIANKKPTSSIRFTPDGRSLVQGFFGEGDGRIRLINIDGSNVQLTGTLGHEKIVFPRFFSIPEFDGNDGLFAINDWGVGSSTSNFMVTRKITFWSAPTGRKLAEAHFENVDTWVGSVGRDSASDRMVVLVPADPGVVRVDVVDSDGTHRRLGTHKFEVEVDPDTWKTTLEKHSGKWIAASTGHEVYVIEIRDHDLSKPRLVARQESLVTHVSMDPLGRYVVTNDQNGRIRLWNLAETSPPRILKGAPGLPYVCGEGSFLCAGNRRNDGEFVFQIWSLEDESPVPIRRIETGVMKTMSKIYLDSPSRHVVRSGADDKIRLWPMSAPADAEPVLLKRGDVRKVFSVSVDRHGRWVAGADGSGVAIWSLDRPPAVVIRRHEGTVNSLVFGPEGRWIASSSGDGTISQWPLDGEVPRHGRVIFSIPRSYLSGVALSSQGDQLLVGGANIYGVGFVHLVSSNGESSRELPTGVTGQFSDTAFSPDGRFVAAACAGVEQGRDEIVVWDRASGEQLAVVARGESALYANPVFLGNEHIMALGRSGLQQWNLESGVSEVLHEGSFSRYAASGDGRRVLLLETAEEEDPGRAVFVDLDSGATTRLDSHGDLIWTVGLDADGEIAVTGDIEGTVRVGRVTGEEPHELLGHESTVLTVVIDPLGRWVASGGRDQTIRLWPMPDLSRPPLHTLPREELIAKLKTLTNLRVVRDEESPTGWKLTHDPFPGWETVPEW